ncbi:sigma-70 family RNA polymerase sigma factor [Bremerella sp. JC817]|uniref:sigma-70 family RNA polymerase sigma factor n=1 Tax=Bremerella sp. JC817 TaxID=3231756 RepID=UPI00345A3AE2
MNVRSGLLSDSVPIASADEESGTGNSFQRLLRQGCSCLTVDLLAALPAKEGQAWRTVKDRLKQSANGAEEFRDLDALKDVTIDMLDALPPTERSIWWDIWQEYSLLMEGTDLRMLSGMAAQDNSAWEKYSVLFTPLLTRQISRLFPEGRAGDIGVEDLVQQVNIKLFLAIGDFRRERFGSFRRYMRLIAAGVIIDTLRSTHRRERHEAAYREVQELLIDESAQSQQWDHEYQMSVLQIAWGKLRDGFNPKHSEVYDRLIEGKSTAEIEAELQVNAANIRQIKKRISPVIKQLLRDWGEL